MPIKRRAARRIAGGKGTKTVRSELRALDLLEYFDRIGRACKVTEVALALGFPQSSTSRLLSELSDAGYLSYDRWKRTYRPSVRTALLSAKTLQRMFPRTPLHMVEALDRISAVPVMLTSRNEGEISVLHTGQDPSETCFHVGERSSLVCSASGQMILSRYQDSHIQALLRRHNADAMNPGQRIRPDDYFERIAQARRQGYLVQPVDAAVRSIGRRCRGMGSAACAVNCCLAQRGPHLVAPIPMGEDADVVAVVGIPADLEERHHGEFAADVKNVIRNHMAAVPDSQSSYASH